MPPFPHLLLHPPFNCITITNLLYVPSSIGNQGDYASKGCGDDDKAGIEVMKVLLSQTLLVSASRLVSTLKSHRPNLMSHHAQ